MDVDLSPIDLSLTDWECIRCRQTAPMRFYGMCSSCRDELRAKYDIAGRDIEVDAYQPKTNVTPNAVALKD